MIIIIKSDRSFGTRHIAPKCIVKKLSGNFFVPPSYAVRDEEDDGEKGVVLTDAYSARNAHMHLSLVVDRSHIALFEKINCKLIMTILFSHLSITNNNGC